MRPRAGAPTARPKTAQGEALGIRQPQRATSTGRRFEHFDSNSQRRPVGAWPRFGNEPGASPRAISGRAVGAAAGVVRLAISPIQPTSSLRAAIDSSRNTEMCNGLISQLRSWEPGFRAD
jgi:hypothetical protein